MKKFLSIFIIMMCLCLPMIFVGCNGTHSITIASTSRGTVSASKTSARAGEKVTLRNTPNVGYEFSNYTLNNQNIDGSSFKMPNSDCTVGAVFNLVTYPINYHLDSDSTNNISNPETFNIETPSFELLPPTKVGYTFEGWYLNENLTRPVTYFSRGTHEDFNIYPKFEKATYTITYNLDGGSNSIYNLPSFNIDSRPITLRAAEKPGYEFLGWYETSDFSGDKIEVVDPKTARNYTLYAKFLSSQTENGYRLITNIADFLALMQDPNNWSMKFKLTTDINLKNHVWNAPIGNDETPFTGEFDGDGHTISNINFSAAQDFAGLFGVIDGATIKNLNISINSVITTAGNNISVGGLVGEAANNASTIENCSVSGLIRTSLSAATIYIGGIIGNAGATNLVKCKVQDLSIYALATSQAYVGGVSGKDGNLQQCAYVSSKVCTLSLNLSGESALAYVGGLVGNSQYRISNCYYGAPNGEISLIATKPGAKVFVGGLVGRLNSINSYASSCYARINKISVEAKSANSEAMVGGLFGTLINAIAENCVLDANIVSAIASSETATKLGVVVGNNYSERKLRNCYVLETTTITGYNETSLPLSSMQDASQLTIANLETILTFLNTTYNSTYWTKSTTAFPSF